MSPFLVDDVVDDITACSFNSSRGKKRMQFPKYIVYGMQYLH